jgi:6-phosphogluconolactonase
MSEHDDIRVHPTRQDTAAHLAADVVAVLSELLEGDRRPRLVLTGGSVAREVHREIASRSQGLDWARVVVLWGDERFVPAGDSERNDRQADEDLLSLVPVTAGHVLRVPAADQASDVHEAAVSYARAVAQLRSGDDREAPVFDLLMLGIGPDGHVASLFPEHPHPAASVVAVEDSPKPPPQRVSMSYDLLGHARRVWFVAVGDDKAEAVSRSVRRDPADLPAARVRGVEQTRWYVDEAAASQLST